MAAQSYFSKLPKRQLVLISEQLIDKNFYPKIYSGYDYNINYDILEGVESKQPKE
jgi:hypothetical protein